jgi:Tol biopolymer transport system component
MLSFDMAKGSDGPGPAASAPRRLDSWKEIASFLGRGIRTVQRWEREEGLPVHRLPHAQRGSVFATDEELSAWWERRQIKPERKPPAPPAPPIEPRLERITNTTAATFWPALSSDARMVVYVSDAGKEGAPPQVWLQQIGGAAMQLTTGLRDCAEPTFSADDTRVIFTASGESTRNVYEIPTLGGTPHVLRKAARSARFSPDGRWLAYIALEPQDHLRLAPATGGVERTLAADLVDIAFATWSDDARHLLVMAHPNASVDLDYWVVPLDGGAPVDTGVLGRGRQQGFITIGMPPAWKGDSIFYSAAGRQGVHVWRQRISRATFAATDSPQVVTHGSDSAYFPTVAGDHLSFLGIRADTNIWSVAIDAASGRAYGPPRRLTRGPGIVSHFSLSHDGRTLAYFAARTVYAELCIKDLETGADIAVGDGLDRSRGFPVISPSGESLAYGTVVARPPVQRPVFLTRPADGQTRPVREDCGGRPRQWLDERTILIETFGAGLNTFATLSVDDGNVRPLLSAIDRKVSNPRVSPDGHWLAFDAMRPGGSPIVLITRITNGIAAPEGEWISVQASASHPFWSRDGRLLYFLPTSPSADIRNQVAARRFDPPTGRLDGDTFDVLSLSEMIVPAMITAVAPIVAPDQIIFVLGEFRGDVWMMDV